MAKKPTPPSDETQALTLEGYAALCREHTLALDAVIARRGAFYRAHQKGDLSAPASDLERAIGERVTALVNGHASALALVVNDPADRDETPLIVEQMARERILLALRKKELPLLAAAAVQYDRDHHEADLALDRETLLCLLRAEALERRRIARWQAAGALAPYLPSHHALSRWWSQSLAGIDWEIDPLREPRETVLAAGIITAAEIRKIQND